MMEIKLPHGSEIKVTFDPGGYIEISAERIQEILKMREDLKAHTKCGANCCSTIARLKTEVASLTERLLETGQSKTYLDQQVTELHSKLALAQRADADLREMIQDLYKQRAARDAEIAELKERVKEPWAEINVSFEDMRRILTDALKVTIGRRLAPEWKPIDSAPMYGMFIVSGGKQGTIVISLRYGATREDFQRLADGSTHWQPLPEPPK